MTTKLDLLVFGATGFTGKYVLSELHKLSKKCLWGVAGRNQKKLKDVLDETAHHVPEAAYNIDSIRIVNADIENEESIKKMTAQTKVLINCCGPFDAYGEIVVKSCIEAGTHYVDVAGEPSFLNTLLKKYAQLAEDSNVYVVNSCAAFSLPADIGVCFMDDNFSGTVNSVEICRWSKEEGKGGSGPIVSYGTWSSIINDFANINKIKRVESKVPEFTPKLPTKLLRKVDNGWAIPIPLDLDVVRRTRKYFYDHHNKRPAQISSYLVVSSLLTILTGAFALAFNLLLAQFKYGRALLLKYPEFFSNGMTSSGTPSESKLESTRTILELTCKGWSDKLAEGQDQYSTPPDKEMVGRISTVNSYRFSALAVTLCAFLIITEKQHLPSKGGVYTPGVAFSKTSLVQLLRDHGVDFEITSTRKI